MFKSAIAIALFGLFSARSFVVDGEGGGNDGETANADDIFDSILDGTLDDIADLPSFAAWPTGAYRVFTKDGFVRKTSDDGKQHSYELKLQMQEVLEIKPEDQESAPKVGDETQLSFGLGTDIGKGFFKEAVRPIVAFLGLGEDQPGAIRAAVEASKGMEFMVILKRRKVTKDRDGVALDEPKFFPTLVKLDVL